MALCIRLYKKKKTTTVFAKLVIGFVFEKGLHCLTVLPHWRNCKHTLTLFFLDFRRTDRLGARRCKIWIGSLQPPENTFMRIGRKQSQIGTAIAFFFYFLFFFFSNGKSNKSSANVLPVCRTHITRKSLLLEIAQAFTIYIQGNLHAHISRG